MASQSSNARYERAVVIGASMAGLAVARALSDHFREVIVIERDALDLDKPAHRPGVPQSWHIHNLTIGGQRALESLFPGFVDAALALGAMRVDHGADVACFAKYGWEDRVQTDFIALSATRILLEHAERQRFLALVKNARLLCSTRVTDLVLEAAGERARVTGVTTNHASERRIDADLVVDCSGRSSGWKHWFTEHSLQLPKETIVDSRCGYSSRFYRPRNPADFNWKALIADTAFPERPHWGVIVPLEQNDWVVTLGGFNGNYPPADEQGFAEFARALPTPLFSQALDRADPLTKVRTFRKLEMRWNHFESYSRVSRFLAVGDSAWSYNPLYGQGMSVAATCARILRDVLSKDANLDTLPKRYYPPARKYALPLWSSTAQLDMRWPGTTGKRPWHCWLSMPLAELTVRAASRNQRVGYALLEGVHMLKPPAAALAAPDVLARIVMYSLRELLVGPPQVQLQLPASPSQSYAATHVGPIDPQHV